MRRHVYVTPKSYLSFIDQYKQVYSTKFGELNTEETNIRNGLVKLKEATEGVEKLKIELKEEDKKLKEASEKTDVLLKEVGRENEKARVKAEEVGKEADMCNAQAAQIEIEQEEANKDLQAAIPYLRRAEAAVDSIKPKDIGEMKTAKAASDTTRIVLDTIQILF